MNARSSLTSAKPLGVTFLAVLFLTITLKAHASEKVLYSFKGGDDGANPSSALVADRNGNLYGTTETGGGGACDCGTVFMLSPPVTPNSIWAETILYRFQGPDGAGPEAGLIFDAAGNLYGTTAFGGTHDGTVFKLAPPTEPGGSWTETVLHQFDDDQKDGSYPQSDLVMDKAGNLYGTTLFGGGGAQAGIVFEVSPPTVPGGSWTETVVHRFGHGNDGALPMASLLIDNKGALYGTTSAVFQSGDGLVFKLSPPVPPQENWRERGLYKFEGVDDGSQPSYITASQGAIYGVTDLGGDANWGTVYQLVPQAGEWKETLIYQFQGGSDGGIPVGQLYVDRSGQLYGTTYAGHEADNGTVFRLSPPQAGGAWVKTKLHEFGGDGDGATPNGSLIKGKGGALYGTTYAGGASGFGVVYAVTP